MSDDKFVNELTQIEEEQRALDARRAAIKKQVVERVKVMIRTYHLTTDDITVPAPSEQDDDGRMVKYRDADGNTWTGRGRKPKWLPPPSTPAPSLMISAPMRIALLKNSDFLQHDQKRNFLG